MCTFSRKKRTPLCPHLANFHPSFFFVTGIKLGFRWTPLCPFVKMRTPLCPFFLKIRTPLCPFLKILSQFSQFCPSFEKKTGIEEDTIVSFFWRFLDTIVSFFWQFLGNLDTIVSFLGQNGHYCVLFPIFCPSFPLFFLKSL